MTGEKTITTATAAGPGAGAYRLLVLWSPERGKAGTGVALGTEPLQIGRTTDEAPIGPRLALTDPEASRAHAMIEPTDDGHRLRDLGSHNGTVVNGERVQARPLADGDVIRIGSHLVLYQFIAFADAQRMGGRRDSGSSLLGQSIAMRRVRDAIEEVAADATPVLVLGESGVGKELVAKELHRLSKRGGPLVAVNCAALPKDLVESELFGHARGAFTGATNPSKGLFGEADGGTLMLDEIGEMPLDAQAKLLRALATGEIRPVGESRTRTVDVRVVAATNVPLDDAVEKGGFRGDLYARLIGCRIDVPPLRARREDVLPLAEHFLAAADASVPITSDAAEALLVHRWRFNVRELEQVVRALARKARGAGALELLQLPDGIQGPVAARRVKRAAPAAPEVPLALRIPPDSTPNAEQLTEVLRHFGGSMARTAEFFGKDRKQVYRWAQKLGVDPDAFRPAEGESQGGDDGEDGGG